MTVPSGVAMLAELEGQASRQQRSIKLPNPTISKELSSDGWNNLALVLFGHRTLVDSPYLKAHLETLGLTVVRQ
jgi:hypothetical protein